MARTQGLSRYARSFLLVAGIILSIPACGDDGMNPALLTSGGDTDSSSATTDTLSTSSDVTSTDPGTSNSTGETTSDVTTSDSTPGEETNNPICDAIPTEDMCIECIKDRCCDALVECIFDFQGCGCYLQCMLTSQDDLFGCVSENMCQTPDFGLIGQVAQCGRECIEAGECTATDEGDDSTTSGDDDTTSDDLPPQLLKVLQSR